MLICVRGFVRQSPIRRRLIAAVGWSTALHVIARAQGAVLLAVAARLLDPISFGTFFVVQASGILAAAVWDLGTTTLLTRDIAAGSADTRSMLRAAMVQRVATFPVFAVLVGVVAAYINKDAGISAGAILFILAGPAISGVSALYDAVLIGHAQFAPSATGAAFGRTVSIILMAGMLAIPPPQGQEVLALAGALAIAEIIILIWQRRAALRRVGEAGSDAVGFFRFTRMALPHAANSMFNFAYQKGDILIIAALGGVVATAHYAPGSQLQNFLALIPTLLAAGLVPTASSDGQALKPGALAYRVSRRIAQVGFALSIPICIGLTLSMSYIMEFILGKDDFGYVVPAVIVTWSLPFLCLHTPLSQALVAQGVASKTTTAFAVSFCGTLVLQFALVPMYGAVGGAIASAARDVIMLVAIVTVARRIVFVKKSAKPSDL